MLTVKLMKGHTMKIVEATTVNIFPAGKCEPVPTPQGSEPMELPTCKVREISLDTYRGVKEAYFVGNAGAECQYGPVELWDCAYIENVHGATTEKISA
jgi:hypothetical protein